MKPILRWVHLPNGLLMKTTSFALTVLLLLSLTAVPRCKGETGEQPPSLAIFDFENSVPLKIVQDAIPSRPFTVVGPKRRTSRTSRRGV